MGQLRKARLVGRNDPCPCGSGRKYKKCCLQRGPVSRRRAEVIRPTGPVSEVDRTAAATVLLRMGYPDEVVYAWWKTGVWVRDGGRESWREEQLAAWDEKIAEFRGWEEAVRKEQFYAVLGLAGDRSGGADSCESSVAASSGEDSETGVSAGGGV